MRARHSLILVTGAVSAFVAGAGADVNVAGSQGPSSSQTPYVVPVAAGVRTVSILTVGDSVNPKLDGVAPYRMVGIPDGLGAFDAGDGTIVVTMNHELGSTAGIARVHGSAGAFVSVWRIDKSTLAVKSGNDLIRTIETWNPATQAYVQGTTAFNRFCSADLPAIGAFYDPATKLGTTERFHMTGEENGSTGRAYAHVATGPNTGVSWELPKLGRQGWENVVACPRAQTKTLVALTDDQSGAGGVANGQVFFYVGTKLAAGNEVQKAGLADGTLYCVVANGAAAELRVGNIGLTKGASGGFTLAALPDQSAAGAVTETDAVNAGATKWLRPEDGAWDPANPSDFYFVTTDQYDQVKDGVGATTGRSRLWRLRFADVTNPTAGGSVTLLLDGTEAGQMFDNVCVDRAGHVLLQEDVGGQAHNGKIFQFDVASGALTLLAQHDPARFGDIGVAATAPYNNDEESSGILDATDLLGPGWFLLVDQAHYGIAGELVEGGQLLALFNPDSVVSPADAEVRLDFSSDGHGKPGKSEGRGDDDDHGDDDRFSFTTEVGIPAGFSPSGKVVSLDFGGVLRTFTLDGKGASNGDSSCRLEVRKSNGSVPAQRAKLFVTARGPDLKSALADEGLTDRDADGEPVSVVTKLTFDGRTEWRVLGLAYDAQSGKKGYAE